MERVVALVDMDCFYVQVEQRLDSNLKGKPCAVVQYNPWKGGGIIAVSYEARDKGVTRNMRGDDAKQKCPNIQLVRVPLVRGKADLTKYREAGAEVIKVLSRFSNCVERASVDEAYIDLTEEVEKRMSSLSQDRVTLNKLPNTHVVGFNKQKDGRELNDWLSVTFDDETVDTYDRQLAVGAVIAEEMRAAVLNDTGFKCSAGIAHNKMLAKLACGFHKPNKQTILPHSEVPRLYATLPIRKIRNLGGKMGQLVSEHLKVENMGELTRFSEKALQQLLGDKNGSWLYGVCRGFDYEPVAARQLPKSIGCSKNFTGKNCLNTREKVKFWLTELAKEVAERLEKDRNKNKRTAKSLTLSVRYESHPQPVSASRVTALIKYDASKVASDAFTQAQQFNTSPPHQASWMPAIISLGLSAGKFQDDSAIGTNIGAMLAQQDQTILSSQADDELVDTETEEPVSNTSLLKRSKLKSVESEKRSIKSFFQYQVKEQISEEREMNEDNSLKFSDKHSQVTETSEKKGSLMSFFKKKQFEKQTQSEIRGVSDRSTSTHDMIHNTPTGCTSLTIADTDETKNQPVENSSRMNADLNSKNKSAASRKNMNSGLKIDTREIRISESASSKSSTIENSCRFVESSSNCDDSNFSEMTAACATDRPKISSSETKSCSQLSENLPDVINLASDDFMECERCSKRIVVWEMPEHMDFHFALDLQKDMDGAERTANTVASVKRKSMSSGEKSNKKAKTDTSQGKLESFFTKFS